MSKTPRKERERERESERRRWREREEGKRSGRKWGRGGWEEPNRATITVVHVSIHHKTSRSRWIILIMMQRFVMLITLPLLPRYTICKKCKHLLSISKAANLLRLVAPPPFIFLWCATTEHVASHWTIWPPAAICINNQTAHMNYDFHIVKNDPTVPPPHPHPWHAHSMAFHVYCFLHTNDVSALLINLSP